MKLKPKPHQKKAIAAAKKHFKTNTRGKLIHPTACGKSLTSLWIAEAIKSEVTLVVVPSIALVAQLIPDWKRELPKAKLLAVCSDKTVAKDRRDDSIQVAPEELGIAVTTDVKAVKAFLKQPGRKVVFSTYQSGDVIKAAAGKAFDFSIFDEAHKTAGNGGMFATLLKDTRSFKIQRRLFQTATERHFVGKGDQVVSMDNKDVYGDYIDVLTYKAALEAGLICDYRLVAVEVSSEEVAKSIEDNAAHPAVALAAYKKAIKKWGINKSISFHSTVARAKAFADKAEGDGLHALHVNGAMSSKERQRILSSLNGKRTLITNARCLTEGVDIPCIDSIIFADARKSKVDVTQAVGRAVRLSPGKELAYIFIPIDLSNATKASKSYERLIDVISSLAESDERVVDEVFARNTARKEGGGKKRRFGAGILDVGDLEEEIELRMLRRARLASFPGRDDFLRAVQEVGIGSTVEYRMVARDYRWPSNPTSYYLGVTWEDITGKPPIAVTATLHEAMAYAKQNGITTRKQWEAAQLPTGMPRAVASVFSDQWTSWPEFFGRVKAIKCTPFNEARAFARSLNLSSIDEWKAAVRDGLVPEGIYKSPASYREFSGYPDFLGYQSRVYRSVLMSFSDAREYAHSLNLKTQTEFYKHVRSKGVILPDGFPKTPQHAYAGEWTGWCDFLGHTPEPPPIYSLEDLIDQCAASSIQRQQEYAEWQRDKPLAPSRPWDKYADWPGFSSFFKSIRASKHWKAPQP